MPARSRRPGSRHLAVALAVLLAGTIPAAAQPAPLPPAVPDAPLRVVWRDAPPSLDPYGTVERNGLVLAHEIWDTLIDRDPDTFGFRPLLATAWSQPDPLTLDFTLRPGVRFHDGSAFTAADVVYTVHRVLTDPAVTLPHVFGFLDGAEATDATHVRLHLRRPFALALDYVAAMLPILPQAYRERVGAAAFGRAPVGTGPYRVAGFDPAGQIELVRFDDYAGVTKPKPAIRRLVIRTVPDDAAEVAALRDGTADWTWMVDSDQLDTLDRDERFSVMRVPSLRLSFVQLDAAGRGDGAGPLTHLDVRRAVFHAINRQAIIQPDLGGGERLLDTPCDPGQFGCDPTAAVHYDYDPARARSLLVRAGYPDGFTVDLVNTASFRDATRIAANLRAVGIAVRLRNPPLAEALRDQRRGAAPIFVGSWGGLSIDDVSAFLIPFFGGGRLDLTGDPLLAEAVDRASLATDVDARRRMDADIIARVTGQADWLPLHTDVSGYAMVRGLDLKPAPDELPRFYEARWR